MVGITNTLAGIEINFNNTIGYKTADFICDIFDALQPLTKGGFLIYYNIHRKLDNENSFTFL